MVRSPLSGLKIQAMPRPRAAHCTHPWPGVVIRLMTKSIARIRGPVNRNFTALIVRSGSSILDGPLLYLRKRPPGSSRGPATPTQGPHGQTHEHGRGHDGEHHQAVIVEPAVDRAQKPQRL